MKYLGLEIYNLHIQNFSGKNDVILLKKFCFLQAPSSYRINFLFYFSIKFIHITRILKTLTLFFFFSAVFEKSAIISRQELSLNRRKMFDF